MFNGTQYIFAKRTLILKKQTKFNEISIPNWKNTYQTFILFAVEQLFIYVELNSKMFSKIQVAH